MRTLHDTIKPDQNIVRSDSDESCSVIDMDRVGGRTESKTEPDETYIEIYVDKTGDIYIEGTTTDEGRVDVKTKPK